jgi:heme-degrading monooxygenase HmoA
MFARISTLQGKPEDLEKEIQAVRNVVVPRARSLKGFKGFRMLVDRSSGKSIGVSFWETEQDMKASEQTANQIREETAQSSGAKITSVERFEIVVDEKA